MGIRSALAGLCALALACGDPQPPASRAAAPTVEVAPSEVADVVPAVQPDPPPPPLDPAQRRRLAEARRAGDSLGGVRSAALFDALDIPDAAIVCEAAHAHIRARDLDGADWLIHRALATLDAPNPSPERREALARCLYDDGVVHAARGDLDLARALYARSIGLRPDATVQTARDHLEAPSLALASAATMDEARAALTRWATRPSGADDVRAGQSAAPTSQVRVPTGDPPIDREVALVTVHVDFGEGAFATDDAFLVLRGPGMIAVVRLAHGYASGVGAESEGITARGLAYQDVIVGDRPEVVLHVRSEENDEDMGECARHGHREESLVICTLDDLACAALPEHRDVYAEIDAGCDDDPASPEDDPGRWHLGGRFAVVLEGDAANITVLATRPGAITPLDYVGSHPLRALVARPEFALVPISIAAS